MEKKEKKKNPQFIRTDRAITQALIRLLGVKPFEKITVQDILSEAPVTRSTFYQHFHDKYEIAERMQETLLLNRSLMQNVVREQSPVISPEVQKLLQQSQDYLQALSKIHTETIDIRQALAGQLMEYYMRDASGPSASIEAQVYANALAAYQLSVTDDFSMDLSLTHHHKVMMRAMLKMFELQNDQETIAFLEKKIQQRFRERKLEGPGLIL